MGAKFLGPDLAAVIAAMSLLLADFQPSSLTLPCAPLSAASAASVATGLLPVKFNPIHLAERWWRNGSGTGRGNKVRDGRGSGIDASIPD